MTLGCWQRNFRKHGSSYDTQKQHGYSVLLIMLLALVNVEAVTSQQQTLGRCSSSADIQLLDSDDLFAAAIACSFEDVSPPLDHQQCQQCQCSLIQALLPAVHQNASSDQQTIFMAAQALLPACLPTVAELWSRLPNLTFHGLSNCKFDTNLESNDCQQQPDLSPTETGQPIDILSTASDTATSGISLSWDALCTCDQVASNASTLCNPQTLQSYISECHARCLGEPNVSSLVPCTDLFGVGDAPLAMINSSTSPSMLNNTHPYDLTGVEETDDNDPTAYYYYDDDQQTASNSQETIPADVLHAIAIASDATEPVTITEHQDSKVVPLGGRYQSSSGMAGSQNVTDASENKTLTDLVQRPAAASPTTAAKQMADLDMQCPWTAVQLYEALAVLSSSGRTGFQELQDCRTDTMPQLGPDCWLPLAFDSYAATADNSPLSETADVHSKLSDSQNTTNLVIRPALARLMESLSVLTSNSSSSSVRVSTSASAQRPGMDTSSSVTTYNVPTNSPVWQLSGYDVEMGSASVIMAAQAQDTVDTMAAMVSQAQSASMFSDSPNSKAESATSLQDDDAYNPTTSISQGMAWPAFCACSHEFDPVCSRRDLRWFPNVCYATCQGIQAEDVGSCPDIVGQLSTSASLNRQSGNGSPVLETEQQSAGNTVQTKHDDYYDEYYVYYY